MKNGEIPKPKKAHFSPFQTTLTMLPIHKLIITREKEKDGSLLVVGRFRYMDHAVITPTTQRIGGAVGYVESKMRKDFWDTAYSDLREPLSELMLLARLCAESNPARYPEAARIGELTEELNELLDWKKQLAAKQEEGKQQSE